MEHVLEDTTDESGNKKSDFKSLDDILSSYEVKEFKLDDSLILDDSTVSQLENNNPDEVTVNSDTAATPRKKTLDSFFEDPQSHPVLKTKYDYTPGNPLKPPNPDPFDDTRY